MFIWQSRFDRAVRGIHYHIKAQGEEIMGKITDAVAALEAAQADASTAIVKEIQQVKDAIAAGNQDEANAAADRVLAVADKLKADKASLDADDPPA
jgi:DNA-binding FadR family transcriptional regulator